jgi:O-antigen/teichoic acid export membrane protein
MAWQGRVLGQSLTALLIGIIALVWLYKDQLLQRTNTWKTHSKDALRFGAPLIPHVIGGFLMVVVDRIIISNLLGKESVGIYMVAFQFGQVIGLLTESFNKAYAPWLFKTLSSEQINKPSIVKWTYAYFVAIILISIPYALFLPFIIGFIVGEEFIVSAQLVIYLALGSAFIGCYYMITNYIFFAKKTEYLAFVTLVCGLINIPITYYLTLHMQLEGAAAAFLITHILFFLLAWLLSQRVYNMPWLRF